MARRICILSLVVCVGVCAGGLASSQAKAPKHPAPTALSPAAATGAFGLDLMRTQPPGNLVLSPDSVATALAMTGTGASGRTATEIGQVLHLRGPERFAEVGDLQQAILSAQAASGESAPDLAIANGVFVQQGFPLEPPFTAGLQDHFGAAPESVDFEGDPADSMNRINEWVSERTRGVIPRILSSLPEGMRLALANAVYLKAEWRYPFKRRDTAPAQFHNSAGSESVSFMHETSRLRYGAGRDFRAVELPYRSSTLSLLIVLPKTKSVGPLQRRLDARGLAGIVKGLSPKDVELSLPRFHLDTEVELKETLEALGMRAAFGEAADFTGISTAAPLKVGFVKHAADFTVDEEGTVAAAATIVGIQLSSGAVGPRNPVRFNANHPFLFFLRDTRTGAVLFAGRLTTP